MRTKSVQREKTSPRSSNRKTKPPSGESTDIERQRRNRPYLEAQAEYLRQRSSDLVVDAVRKAVPVIQEHRNKLVRASVIPSGDVNTFAKEKKKLRNSLNRMLLKTVPKYKMFSKYNGRTSTSTPPCFRRRFRLTSSIR